MSPAAVELNNTFLFRLKAGKKERGTRRKEFSGVRLEVLEDKDGSETISISYPRTNLEMIPGNDSVVDTWDEPGSDFVNATIRSGFLDLTKDGDTLRIRLEDRHGGLITSSPV